MNYAKQIQALNNGLINQLLSDLGDPTKCTPGLYLVIRGMIADNKDVLDNIPNSALEELEAKLATKAPFKFKVG